MVVDSLPRAYLQTWPPGLRERGWVLFWVLLLFFLKELMTIE